MSALFGFYGLGLSSLRAAQLGIEIAGENIANVNTPGFTRRRVDLATGFPVPVLGGFLNNGVDVSRIRREEDRLLQATLEREKAGLGLAEERLRGLQDVELTFGDLDSQTISGLYAGFSSALDSLAATPTDLALRRGAVDAAGALATELRVTASRLTDQQRQEDRAIRETVGEVNALAQQLADLNRQIAQVEVPQDGKTSLRDQRNQVVEQLRELTGATTYEDEEGRIQAVLPSGGSLVVADEARTLTITNGANGLAELQVGGRTVTGEIRGGKLGAQFELRDEKLPERLAELDDIAFDLTTRANALTTSAFDRNGNAGTALFVPDPPDDPGAALTIQVSTALQDDPALLAVSADGTAGNGDIAAQLAALRTTAGARLGGRSPNEFITDLYANVGQDVASADVAVGVSTSLVQTAEARRDATSGVSLDEEAVDLVTFQRTYEASARFISVLNELTEVAVNLAR